jgi:hypothetical protein
VFLKINSDYFRKHQRPTGFRNGDAVFFPEKQNFIILFTLISGVNEVIYLRTLLKSAGDEKAKY